jgi:hypothetical protein
LHILFLLHLLFWLDNNFEIKYKCYVYSIIL